jgi:hypothetical protein
LIHESALQYLISMGKAGLRVTPAKSQPFVISGRLLSAQGTGGKHFHSAKKNDRPIQMMEYTPDLRQCARRRPTCRFGHPSGRPEKLIRTVGRQSHLFVTPRNRSFFVPLSKFLNKFVHSFVLSRAPLSVICDLE